MNHTLKILFLTFLATVISYNIDAQDSINVRINQLFNKLAMSKHSDSSIQIANNIVELILKKCELQPIYESDFSEVKYLTSFISEDELLRIFTFGYKLPNGANRFEGLIYYREKKKKPAKVTRLYDTRLLPESPEFASAKRVNWFGTQYYALVTKKDGKTPVYTLLGYGGTSQTTTLKSIDILTFNSSGKPMFGKKYIKLGNQKTGRLEFEYTLTAVFKLSYLSEEDMVIFDQLAPIGPGLPNLPEYLGPVGIYNGFKFEDEVWILRKNIDIRNLKTKFD